VCCRMRGCGWKCYYELKRSRSQKEVEMHPNDELILQALATTAILPTERKKTSTSRMNALWGDGRPCHTKAPSPRRYARDIYLIDSNT